MSNLAPDAHARTTATDDKIHDLVDCGVWNGMCCGSTTYWHGPTHLCANDCKVLGELCQLFFSEQLGEVEQGVVYARCALVLNVAGGTCPACGNNRA